MIAVQNICKGYGSQVLFTGISFNVNSRERIGLVGRNGHGKSTLFKILTGEETADDGKILIPEGYRIGYLNQHINFTKPTVLDEACLGLPEGHELDDWKGKKILSGLGFSEEDFSRDPSEFSGGFQLRINLAKVLLSDPNLLLLDEPTNFLDILSIRWMINFLRSWPNELIIISHDRSFMDSVVTHIVGIHRGGIKKIAGHTGAYYDKVAEEEELYERQRVNEDKKRAEMEQFVTRFKAKASKAKLVQSRVKALDKMEQKDKLGEISSMRFSFSSAPFPAKKILEVRGLSFGYDPDGPKLFEDINLTVGSRDRIAIIGKNGKGKTTLLKLLAGALDPTEGEIRYHPQAASGYFEQTNTAGLHENMTIEEEMISVLPTGDRRLARSICGAMMFSGDLALKKTGVLSGGEKCRVMLGKILATPSNIVLLDEPTNHLDMQSCEAMGKAISSFDGAAVIVTHSEGLLRKVANRLIVFHNDKVFLYEGKYKDFLKEIGWGDDEAAAPKKKQAAAGDSPQNRLGRKELKRARADFNTKRSKIITPLEKKMAGIEAEIEAKDMEIAGANEALVNASRENDGKAITELSRMIQQIKKSQDALYAGMEKISNELEKQRALFDEERKGLFP